MATKWRTRGKGSRARHFPIRGGRGRSRLTYNERQKLPPSAFAIPDERKYPVPTVEQLREAGVPNPEKAAETHARNALARVSADGTESEKRRVCRMVRQRHPEIHSRFCEMHRDRRARGAVLYGKATSERELREERRRLTPAQRRYLDSLGT